MIEDIAPGFEGPSPFGVCLCAEPPPNVPRTISYPGYLDEILGHFGLLYRRISAAQLESSLADLSLLLTVGNPPAGDTLRQWVDSGGAWLHIGDPGQYADMFGVEREQASF